MKNQKCNICGCNLTQYTSIQDIPDQVSLARSKKTSHKSNDIEAGIKNIVVCILCEDNTKQEYLESYSDIIIGS